MKKIFYFLLLVGATLSFQSCTCECVGPNDGDPNNKVCKVEYENLYGEGTWANYEYSAKASGYTCK